MRLFTSFLAVLAISGIGLNAADTACDPFIPQRACHSQVDFTSGVHDTIAVLPQGTVKITIIDKPAFSTCQATLTPGPLTRSADSAISGFLTALGGLGLVGGNPVPVRVPAAGPRIGRVPGVAPPPPPDSDARNIDYQLAAIRLAEKSIANDLEQRRQDYRTGLDDKNFGFKLIWKVTDETTVTSHIAAVQANLKTLVDKPEPSIASLQAELSQLARSMGEYHLKHDSDPSVADWVASADASIDEVNGLADGYRDLTADIAAIRTGLKQALAEINASKPPYTQQDLDLLPRFANNIVGVSISCKDDLDQTTSPVSVSFSAYYTRLPWIDFSAGPLFSLLGRHQVGVLAPTAAQSAAGTNPNGTFGLTDHSSFQVIPMAFLELHTRGFKCPWADR